MSLRLLSIKAKNATRLTEVFVQSDIRQRNSVSFRDARECTGITDRGIFF